MVTPLQYKVFIFVKKYLKEHGFSPTLEEIARGIGISHKSISLISRSVQALKKAGMLTLKSSGYRNIALVTEAPKWVLPHSGKIISNAVIEKLANNTYDFGPFLKHPEYSVLEVAVDTFEDEGFYAGDILIYHETEKGEEGDIVLAILDDAEMLIKRLSYQIKDHITLIPSNPKLKPTAYLPKRIKIKGVLKALFRIPKIYTPSTSNSEV